MPAFRRLLMLVLLTEAQRMVAQPGPLEQADLLPLEEVRLYDADGSIHGLHASLQSWAGSDVRLG